MSVKPGVIPIAEKFLQPNYLFALEVREGFLFGRVVRRRICNYAPYSVIDTSGATVDISASGSQDTLRLRDPRNTETDVLYLDTATNAGYAWFFHGAVGIKPSWVFMYPSYPETKEIPGKFPNLDPVRPGSGDNFSYVDSLRSPYDSPTDFVEYVILPHLHVGFDFYNKDAARSHNPVLNVLFALYWIQLFKVDTHGDLMKRIALREVPASFLQHGFGDMPIDAGGKLLKDWDVKPMSLDEAIAGGR